MRNSSFKSIKLAFSSIFIVLFLASCSTKEPIKPIKKEFSIQKSDLNSLSNSADDNFLNQESASNNFLTKYFNPWLASKLSYPKNEAMWGLSYANKKIYLENHKLASKEWFDSLISNTNFEEYNLNIKKAITLKNTNVRVMPTNSPFFYNPTLPGEGFPFDYNQNSLLKINTPLIVSHLSLDKAWAYVESHFVGGWVEINSIAFVDENFINEFKTNSYFMSIKEKFPIYDINFKEYVKLGTLFPRQNGKFLIAKKDEFLNAKISYIDLNSDEIEQLPLKFNNQNRVKILNTLLDEPYGWGGLLNNRDCSSFTQDYFAVFGKYLHRNSKSQTFNGKYLDMSNLNLEEKKEFIRKNGIPFSTLVYLKGHIMLYIGLKNSEPIVAHNVWSIRLKDKNNQEFRHIIGKATLTTLEPGIELEGFTKDSNILNKVLGITILN